MPSNCVIEMETDIMAAAMAITDGNLTNPNATGDTDMENMEAVIPMWLYIMNIFQNVTNVIGIIANIMTLITLHVNGEAFSGIICLLLKYQSVLDALVCLAGLFLNVLPEFWGTGVYVIDLVVCQLWHSTFVVWTFICMSTWNLVTLAVERYICICHPIRYTLLTKSKVRLMIVACFGLCLLFGCCTPLQTSMNGDTCEFGFISDTPAFNKLMAFYGITAFFSYYAVPTVLFMILYGRIIQQFHVRSKMSLGASGTATVIDKATSELTKTSIIVTIIFILSYSWDLWYYFLGYLGVVEYIINSPLQKIGTCLALLNSGANPFVYASLMPAYRRSVQKTFTLPCWKDSK